MVQGANTDWTVNLHNGQHRLRKSQTESKEVGGGQYNRQDTRHNQTLHG